MNILIARSDKIGDLVLSIASFYTIKKMYRDAKLIVLVNKYNGDIIKNLDYIDEIIKIDDYSKSEIAKKIKSLNLDVFIALYSNSFIAKLARKSKAKIKIGPYSKFSSFFSYNRGMRQKRSESTKHEAEYNLDLIKKLDEKLFGENFKLTKVSSMIKLKAENKKNAIIFFKDNNIDKKNNLFILYPFSGNSSKNLTINQYIEIGKIIIKNFKNSVIIVASDPENEAINKKIVEKIGTKNTYSFVNKGSILNFAALINECDYFIGGSTGPIHIAASLGKKIIAIYPNIKGQAKKRWGIFNNKNVYYLESEITCNEKYKCNLKCKNYNCFDKINLKKIKLEKIKILEKGRSNNES